MGHTLLVKSIKSNTIMLYLKAAALLCKPRSLSAPLFPVVLESLHRLRPSFQNRTDGKQYLTGRNPSQ
eukprot:3846440-Ditylum_brightwellii.AAC.1